MSYVILYISNITPTSNINNNVDQRLSNIN